MQRVPGAFGFSARDAFAFLAIGLGRAPLTIPRGPTFAGCVREGGRCRRRPICGGQGRSVRSLVFRAIAGKNAETRGGRARGHVDR